MEIRIDNRDDGILDDVEVDVWNENGSERRSRPGTMNLTM